MSKSADEQKGTDMSEREKLIDKMKEVLAVRGQYQEDYHAGKFTVKGNRARFIQWPEFMADLMLEDRKRICEPLIIVSKTKNKDTNNLGLDVCNAIAETLKRAGLDGER